MACENEQRTLNCSANRSIIITSAFYGRLNKNYCPGANATNVFCTSNMVLSAIQRLCNNKQTCSFSVNGQTLGGDPCPSSSKYFNLNFNCVCNRVPNLLGLRAAGCPSGTRNGNDGFCYYC
jgi:hypothetical protein